MVFSCPKFRGVTAPPFHPNCRCTTIPYFDDEFAVDEQRVMRNQDGKSVLVDDLSYAEYRKLYFSNDSFKSFINSQKDAIISEIKDIGIKGEISLEPFQEINTNKLSFDDEHINFNRSHNVGLEEAKSYIDKAAVYIKRWNGEFINYYSKAGASFVNVKNKNIRTTFKAAEYSDNIQKMIKVLKKWRIIE